jgi:hypothetical protein
MVQANQPARRKEPTCSLEGVITIRAFNQLLLSIQKAENCERRDWLTEKER